MTDDIVGVDLLIILSLEFYRYGIWVYDFIWSE